MDLEQKAIKRIQFASELSLKHYNKPLVCTYSGGKDSDVMLELFRRAGIPFEVHNSHTTADAPQTVRHIRKVFKSLEEKGIKCEIEMPKYKGEHITMWKLIPLKLMPPTIFSRYCCAVLKETGCPNRYIATGVRLWICQKKTMEIIQPIRLMLALQKDGTSVLMRLQEEILMIDLTGKSVFVRTQEEYSKVLRIAKLQGFRWARGKHLNAIDIPLPNMLNFYDERIVTYRSDERKMYEASEIVACEKKLEEAMAHVKYFANNKDRMSLTDKVIESMLLLANTVESQLEEVK